MLNANSLSFVGAGTSGATPAPLVFIAVVSPGYCRDRVVVFTDCVLLRGYTINVCSMPSTILLAYFPTRSSGKN
jgi:hypothetical protein